MDTQNVEETARELTPREKTVRDKFVEEYLTDYNALAACIRIGYAPIMAKDFSVSFLQEPYTLQKIRDAENAPVEVNIEIEKHRVLKALWREANNMGTGSSQSARVAALSKISAFYGMDAPKRSELTGADGQPLGQGVLVIPGIMSPEQWEEQAGTQQENLTKPEPVTLTAVPNAA